MTGRRAFLGGMAALALPLGAGAGAVRYASVLPGTKLVFPRDHGAHPGFRNEWWYVTGWLKAANGDELGFQATFFRSRPPFEPDPASSFAPRQLLLAHAALSDPGERRLRHDQRAARAALGLAGASEATTEAWIDDWRIELRGSTYRLRIPARDFALELECEAGGPPLLQGEAGYSRKGPLPEQASWYYSRPHLAVRGSVVRGGGREAVHGSAWLDHEWSSTLMPPGATGWDWIGVNLERGGALMAFRMRDAAGRAQHAGGTLALGDGPVRKLEPHEVDFRPSRLWHSPRTGVEYPVSMTVRTAGSEWRLEPLFDDQELDARASTGTVYWEGAVRCLHGGREFGRGYLELTGYWRPFRI